MQLIYSLGLVALWTPVAIAASTLEGSFQIYAYGEGIGGLPLFYSNGKACVGNYTQSNDTEAAPVIFRREDGALLGSPNTTGFSGSDGTPSWSNYSFSVPSSSSSSHDVDFIQPNADSSAITNKFSFYGTLLFIEGGGGMETLWYGRKSDKNGIYSLKWNNTGDNSDGNILLTLKTTPPSN